MSEKLKQIIEDLDRSSLNQYVYDLLMHLPDEQKLFIRKYDNKAKSEKHLKNKKKYKKYYQKNSENCKNNSKSNC